MRIFTFSTIFALMASLAIAKPLYFAGSDLLETSLEKSIKEYSQETNDEINLNFDGSLRIIDDVKSGVLDIAVVAVPNNSKHLLEGLRAYPIAYQSVVVSVNEANTIKELSLSDLELMYFAKGSKYSRTWTDFAYNSNSPVQSAFSSAKANMVVSLFQWEVSPKQAFADWVRVEANDTALANFVSSTNSAIAISAKPLQGTKTVPLLSTKANFAVLPSGESLYNDEYPINLAFYIVFDAKNIAKVKDFAKFLYGKRSSEAFENAGFYAIPEIFRKKIILGLDF